MPEPRHLLPSSLRERLLLWSALILALVLGSFVLALLQGMRHSLINELDEELRSHAGPIAAALSQRPGGGFELDMPGGFLRYFQERGVGADAPFYAVWDAAGSLVDRSDPDIPLERPTRPLSRTRDGFREVVVEGQHGTLVLVGAGTSRLEQRLSAVMRLASGAAALALALALLGGWFLTTRALAPIDRITHTVAVISASNLDQRIDTAQTESELDRLAQTLNATFDRLAAGFERQTRFTADASHELRTPLTVVISQAELALRRPRQPEEYRDALEAVLRAARRMRSVVEGLLTLARADTGELPLQPGGIELRELVSDTVGLLEAEAAQRDVSLGLELEQATIRGDRSMLQELVTNLVSNAIRYNRKQGRVDLRLTSQGSKVVLEVTDTGIGIASEDLDQVFERFYRVDKARSREHGGSGLGLAISRWIVEAHGGRIQLTSRLGEGTTARVELPGGMRGLMDSPG